MHPTEPANPGPGNEPTGEPGRLPTVPPRPSRWVAYLCPPWGILQLWRLPGGLVGKIVGTIGLLGILVLDAALAIFVLKQIGVVALEWRGAGVPHVVWAWHRAMADYDALETHRRQQAVQPASDLTFTDDVPWPGFRGPARDGVSTQRIRLDWDQQPPRLLWRQPCGGGHSSFAVARGRAFTLEQRRDKEAVVAYHLETGRELWHHEYSASFIDEYKMGDVGPRATPAWDNGRVYAFGAEGHFFCLAEDTGQVIWQKNVLALSGGNNLDHGMAASPLVVDHRLIVAGGAGRFGLLALDKESGTVLWKSATGKGSFSSPQLATLDGQALILYASGAGLNGIALEDGAVLWRFPWPVSYDNNIAQPVVLDAHRVFISAGYGAGCALLDIRQSNGEWQVSELWRNRYMKNKFSSSVLWQGHLYGLDETVLTCLDAQTGARLWKGDRYGYGQLVLASGHLIIVTGDDGDLALVHVAPNQPRPVARFSALGARTWNHPVLADGRLLIRNAKTVACYDVSASPAVRAP